MPNLPSRVCMVLPFHDKKCMLGLSTAAVCVSRSSKKVQAMHVQHNDSAQASALHQAAKTRLAKVSGDGAHDEMFVRADPLMQVALSVFNTEWSAVTLVSQDRQMYVANAKGTKVTTLCPLQPGVPTFWVDTSMNRADSGTTCSSIAAWR